MLPPTNFRVVFTKSKERYTYYVIHITNVGICPLYAEHSNPYTYALARMTVYIYCSINAYTWNCPPVNGSDKSSSERKEDYKVAPGAHKSPLYEERTSLPSPFPLPLFTLHAHQCTYNHQPSEVDKYRENRPYTLTIKLLQSDQHAHVSTNISLQFPSNSNVCLSIV